MVHSGKHNSVAVVTKYLQMADPTYVIPGAAIHSFTMFAPFFALWEQKAMAIQGIFLFAFGPALAGYITPNLMEQASIWCFFSIAQIAIMLFFIRASLVKNWGLSDVKKTKTA